MFVSVNLSLCESGSLRRNMHNTESRQPSRSVNIEEQVHRRQFECQPMHYCSDAWVCDSAVWRILHEHGEHSYYLQRVQLQQPNEYQKYE
ncbi:hypothetical protein TNCT_17891 [Trichonephila clavata]|uniref:Uncharacterized protein n=1 Tax=Trichonephila clavata TaxID=2740835 RepID=A0A8X6LG25_TRICU|nr:hypothetical protein TNCT_17891 [Trichonephila clavata]